MDSRIKGKSLDVLRALMAGGLILIVSGCEQKPIPSDANRKAEPDISKAAKKVDQAIKLESDKSPAAAKDNENVKLAAIVKEALMKDPALKATTIDVNASDGVIELFGTVDDTASLRKAGRIASNVPGVKRVRNYLVIIKGS